jgi:VWFA-related protein
MHRAIEGIRAAGLTSIIDALYGALSVRFAPERRSLILLFSDGFDNRSWATAGEVTTRAQQSETIIDAVAYRWTSSLRGPGSRTTEPDVSFLRSLAADTGGEVIVSSRPDDFSRAFLSLLERARSRYLVTYYPKGVDRAGWHDVKVTLRNHRGSVTVRRGYAVLSDDGRD